MSTGSHEMAEFTYKGERSVLMACAVGFGHQPVLCNIVGSEPLFYIEEEYAADGYLFEDVMDAGIDEDFFNLREADPTRIERLRGAMARIERDRSFNAATSLNADRGLIEGRETVDTLSMDQLIGHASKSGWMRQALSFATNNGVSITLSGHVETALYDREARRILVNPCLPVDQAVLHFSRALRMVEHHQSGILVHPLMFDPEQAVLINRVMDADMAVTVTRVAWDLKLAGNSDAWIHLISGAAYDLASAFAREAGADFRSLSNGHAQRATFEQWFLSSRCKSADRHLIQTMLADHHGYVFASEQFTNNLTKDVLARLGDSHLGENYLISILDQVLTDPLYNEIRDRSNANFLWFIKFERSFRDSEEDLGLARQAEAEKPQADIIRMSDHRPMGSTARHTAHHDETGDNDGATIYYLTHFAGLH